MEIQTYNQLTAWEVEFVSFQKKYLEFLEFKNNHTYIQDWSIGYFSVLPNEILEYIISFTYIKDTIFICKLFHNISKTDKNILCCQKFKQIRDSLYYRHKFKINLPMHIFLRGIKYHEQSKVYSSRWGPLNSNGMKRYTFPNSRDSEGYVVCDEKVGKQFKTLFTSLHGKKISYYGKDNIPANKYKIIKKEYKIPNTSNKFVLHKWIKWVRKNKILPEDCSREEMLAIFPFIK